MNKNKELITIVSQAFYGNRTRTKIKKDNMDRFILGYLDSNLKITGKIDRTIIRIPNTNNLVLIYNKYEEKERLGDKEFYKESDYVLKPLATIPEINLEVYSRCIVCRMNNEGEFEILQEEDYDKFMKYLAV